MACAGPAVHQPDNLIDSVLFSTLPSDQRRTSSKVRGHHSDLLSEPPDFFPVIAGSRSGSWLLVFTLGPLAYFKLALSFCTYNAQVGAVGFRRGRQCSGLRVQLSRYSYVARSQSWGGQGDQRSYKDGC